jgi:hypothetical protein
MPTISLTSFLRILTKGTPQKVKEYGRYLTPGGYNFYWRLKEAAHCLTVGGDSFADCAKSVEEVSNEVERECNLKALKSLHKWISKHKVTEFFDPPAGSCSSPGGCVTIKLEPEFGAVMNGQRRIVQLWNSKLANLNRNAAGVGIYLLQKHLCVGEFANCKSGILDLRKGELFLADALPSHIEAMVASEFAWLDGFFKSYSEAA